MQRLQSLWARWRTTIASMTAQQMAWVVFALTLVIMSVSMPVVLRRWTLTGDEPHYLIVAHSLTVDGDVYLENNYASNDYRHFYPGDSIDPHVTTGPDGHHYPRHALALPVLLTPAYALGAKIWNGWACVVSLLCLVTAALAANAFLLTFECTGSKWAACLGWLAVFTTVPVLHYGFMIYPEIPGALIGVWVLRKILKGTRNSPWMWAVLGAATGLLLWLVFRFIIVAAALGVTALVVTLRERNRRHGLYCLAAYVVGAGLAGSALLFVTARMYGAFSPLSVYSSVGKSGRSVSGYLSNLSLVAFARGASAWLFDQDRGILVFAPIYALALGGAFLLLKRSPGRGSAVLAPVALTFSWLASRGYWWQWGLSARHLVATLPFLAVPIGLGWSVTKGKLLRVVIVLSCALSFVHSAIVLFEPKLPYEAIFVDGRAGLIRRYARHLGLDMQGFLPSFRSIQGALIADVSAAGEVGRSVIDPTAARPARGVSSDEQVVMASAATDPPGFIFRRVWPYSAGAIFPVASGDYIARFRLKVECDASATDTVPIILSVKQEGQTLSKDEIAPDACERHAYQNFDLEFQYDGESPLEMGVYSAGIADVYFDNVILLRQQSAGWILLSAVWIGAIAVFSWCVVHQDRASPGTKPTPRQTQAEEHRLGKVIVGGGVALALLLWLGVSYVERGRYLGPRLYEEYELVHLGGERVREKDASGGYAYYVAPLEEGGGRTIHLGGPYVLFPEGKYEVLLRLRTGNVKEGTPVGYSQVVRPASTDVLAGSDIIAQGSDEYYTQLLAFENPTEQFLEVQVFSDQITELWLDSVAFCPHTCPAEWR